MQQSVDFMNNSNMNLTSWQQFFYDVAFYFSETQKSQNTKQQQQPATAKTQLINELIKKTVNGGALI